MMFDHQGFSKAMKIALTDYLFEQAGLNKSNSNHWLQELELFDVNTLKSDREKTAFWINIYNGFTNYQIITNKLESSVWEKPDFFSDRSLKIRALNFSLDDIEHGILRRNGKRRNNKPKQFSEHDPRGQLMVEKLDYRIHFALNCGSISCPALAFYSESQLDEELNLAEQSFVEQEFLVDHDEQRIHCSSIFIWYREDFKNLFLNDPKLSHYSVTERPYYWKIK